MTVTCPYCGFSRDVEADKIPALPIGVTCPRCRERFTLQPDEENGPPFQPEFPAVPGEAPEEDRAALPKAGFWIRCVAWVIDSMFLAIVQGALTLLLGVVAAGQMAELGMGGEIMMAMIFLFFGMVLSWAYYIFFTGYCGQTPGKMAVHIKVIRSDAEELGFGRAFLREIVGKFVSTVLLGIGYLMVAFDGQKQGLHDKIAGTYVIKLQG